MKSILIVEDDTMIGFGLMYALEKEGYFAVHSQSVEEANLEISKRKFDLAILDMQLPDGTGFDVKKLLEGSETEIIFLTVVDDENKIVKAFEGGAADYITKPFRLRELLARVKRTLNAQGSEINEIKLGDVTINTSSGKVYIGDELVELTALEYRLLLTFANNRGQVLTRNQILEHIWDSTGNYVEDNTLTVYVKRLREKLGDGISIETIRGIGYRVD